VVLSFGIKCTNDADCFHSLGELKESSRGLI
jgi:hypothetical protein